MFPSQKKRKVSVEIPFPLAEINLRDKLSYYGGRDGAAADVGVLSSKILNCLCLLCAFTTLDWYLAFHQNISLV